MTRKADTGSIVIAAAPDGAWVFFMGMPRTPQPAYHWLPSIDVARSFAITFHQVHGWSIVEPYPGDVEDAG